MALLGVVVCGGRSSRMGTDKSQLIYYDKPQHEHVADMLAVFCEKVVISCNAIQSEALQTPYEKLPDAPGFADRGPISAVLTAFKSFPRHDLLVTGCDYPFLSTTELKH